MVVIPIGLLCRVVGDLTFFYDLNSFGQPSYRDEFHVLCLSSTGGVRNFAWAFIIAMFLAMMLITHTVAAGHFGNKSPLLVKHCAEDLGFHYLSATTKEEFMTALSNFTNPQLSDHSMILKSLLTSKEESEALYLMSHIQSDAKGMVRSKLKDAVRNVAGEKALML
ncbi:MAG: hypothetical protein ACLUVG_21220 [Phocaeicola vulgatus]